MKHRLGIILAIAVTPLISGCGPLEQLSDPEFENCYIEIITHNGDTLQLDSAYVEIEGRLYDPILTSLNKGDHILIEKPNAKWSYHEDEIKKLTIIWEAPNE